jgi:rhodanese-related sulfurtransferase
MADFLVRAGFNAHFVGGGTLAWARAGHPIVYGAERHPT